MIDVETHANPAGIRLDVCSHPAERPSPELEQSAKRAVRAAAYASGQGIDFSSAGIRIITDPSEMYWVEEELYRNLHAGQPYTKEDIVRSFQGAGDEQSFYLVLETTSGEPVLASRTGFVPPADEACVTDANEPVLISAALTHAYPHVSYPDLRFLARVANISPQDRVSPVRGGFRPLAAARLLLLQADWLVGEKQNPSSSFGLITKARRENTTGAKSSAELWSEIFHAAGFSVHCPGLLLRERDSVPRDVLIAGVMPESASSVFQQTKQLFVEATIELQRRNPGRTGDLSITQSLS